MAIRVLVVDDSFVMRALIRDILAADPDLEVVGEAANGRLALDEAKALTPNVILLDIEMPVMDGIECLKRLRLVSRAKVVIVSSVAQLGSPQAMEAQRLGAVRVVEKPSGAMSLDLGLKKGHEIVQAVRAAAGLAAL
jgi:two-component system chemotaxis response regulator CheB